MAQVLDGLRIRKEIFAELRPRIEQLRSSCRAPGLAVILVGENPASAIYVRNKVKACEELGIYSETHTPPASVTTEELSDLVHALNRRPEIDGILVQMPLPPHVDARAVLLAVDPDKDVDGFHPLNVGRLVTGRPGLRPCTPSGILELLKRHSIPIAGREAVVVGRSDIVGKPVALMLLQEHATVTICHSRTRDLASVCRRADILVAAMGRPAAITGEFLKPGATVIDVGTNRLHDRAEVAAIFRNDAAKLAEFDRKGALLVGDVHPLDAAEKAGAYTPVPGGVGPLTIAMLMANTVEAAERRLRGC
ncbi:MAG: bifunctional methylenetetrahydrofolate dehydrogenase/methenyltetrahydrofolate cyclohydrolase FolD [Bryobacterales bacterium]|nr:bifunctional methylenetetrahydrofolate dehydrogenase/methenyltetrahydrofolate cyclohydrolase FolD [Bryobacterales bacterium]